MRRPLGKYRPGMAGTGYAATLRATAGTDVLTPNMLRALAAVMGHFHECGHAANLMEVCARLGRPRRNNAAVVQTLARLRRLGLVTKERRTARSIRPCCRFVPADRL